MQLRAPKIMTMGGPVLDDHCIGIADDRIAYLLPIAEAPHDPQVIDLPHTTLLPGFVNAHCHMDLSHLRDKASYTGSFAGWIQKIVTLRQHGSETEIQAAARALIRSGVTTVMDHVGADSALTNLRDTPLRRFMFLEVLGLTSEKAAAALAHQSERALEARRQGASATPSPHATYSVCAEVFKEIIQSSCRTGSGIQSDEHSGSRLKAGMTSLLSIHCAEGAEEWELFVEGRGKLWEFVQEQAKPCHPEVLTTRHPGSFTACHPEAKLKDLKAEILRAATDDSMQKDQLDSVTYASPLQYLSHNNLLPHSPWLAVHCNTLTDADIELLKRTSATVVHCPRSHRYFSHPPFPLKKLRAAGVPVAIGTDSLASCPNFDFLEELRTLREAFAFLTTNEILNMASTVILNPSQPVILSVSEGSGCSRAGSVKDLKRDSSALPQNDKLAPGAFADIIGLPQQNDLLNGPITFSMIGGKRVI